MWTTQFYLSVPTALETYQVGIYATGTGWNDFGYTLRVNIRLKISGVFKDISARLLAFTEDKPQGSVDQWIKYLHDVKNGVCQARTPNKIFPPFTVVLATEKTYRELATSLGKKDYEQFLIDIKEINAIHHAKMITTETFNEIVKTNQFSVGVLRDTAPYRSFRFGYTSAFRLPPMDDARKNFSFSTKLDGFENNHNINFEYKDIHPISDRAHTIIGVNGIGKTRYLNSLIIAILKKLNSTFHLEECSKLYDKDGEIDLSTFNIPDEDWSALPSFSRIIAYSSDLNNILPKKVSLEGPFDYTYFDIGGDTSQTLSQLIVDIMRNDVDFINSESRFLVLKRIITKLIPSARLLVPLRATSTDFNLTGSDGKKWTTLEAIRGGEMRRLDILSQIDLDRDLAFQTPGMVIVPLSSGQKLYFRFATHFLTHASHGMLILIDEPETHLHPNLITEFMDLLYMVLEATSSVAIIATHSAYVVREAPSHCVHVIKSDDNQSVRTEGVYLNTLGASVTSLSNTVFGDSLVKSFHSKIASEIAKKGLSLDEIIDQYSNELSMEMLIKIRELMREQGE